MAAVLDIALTDEDRGCNGWCVFGTAKCPLRGTEPVTTATAWTKEREVPLSVLAEVRDGSKYLRLVVHGYRTFSGLWRFLDGLCGLLGGALDTAITFVRSVLSRSSYTVSQTLRSWRDAPDDLIFLLIRTMKDPNIAVQASVPQQSRVMVLAPVLRATSIFLMRLGCEAIPHRAGSLILDIMFSC